MWSIAKILLSCSKTSKNGVKDLQSPNALFIILKDAGLQFN